MRGGECGRACRRACRRRGGGGCCGGCAPGEGDIVGPVAFGAGAVMGADGVVVFRARDEAGVAVAGRGEGAVVELLPAAGAGPGPEFVAVRPGDLFPAYVDGRLAGLRCEDGFGEHGRGCGRGGGGGGGVIGDVPACGPVAGNALFVDGAYPVVVGCAAGEAGVAEGGGGERAVVEPLPAAGAGPRPELVAVRPCDGGPGELDGGIAGLCGEDGRVEGGGRVSLGVGCGVWQEGEEGEQEEADREGCRQ